MLRIERPGPHRMGIADMAVGSFYLSGRLLPTFLLLLLVLAVPPALLLAAAVWLWNDAGGAVRVLSVAAFLVVLNVSIFYFVAAITLTTGHHLQQLSIGARQLVRLLWGSLLYRVLAAGFAQGVVTYAGLLALALGIVAVDGPTERHWTLPAGALAAGVLVGFFLMTSVIFVQPAVVLEGRRPTAALKQSWRLARGLRLRLSAALGLFYSLLGALIFVFHELHGVLPDVVDRPLDVVAVAVVIPAALIFPVLLYYDALDRQGRDAPKFVVEI